MISPAISDDAAIDAIGQGLVACTLPRPHWTHAAHFAATLWLLKHDDEEDVARRLPDIIRQYNDATGTPNTDHSGYHETITRASLHIAQGYLRQKAEEPLHETLNRLLASPYGQAGWLFTHWSQALLMSPHARRVWTPPDLRPLPLFKRA